MFSGTPHPLLVGRHPLGSRFQGNFRLPQPYNDAVGIYWDIGANIGGTALPLLKKFDRLHAILFEPSAEVAGRLLSNLSINPAISQRSTVFNVALSDSTGLNDFFVSNEPFNSGTAGLGHTTIAKVFR